MIYLVEDDDSIRDFVIYTLKGQGMEAEGFALPSAFWKAMERRMPSLVILDLMLPEEDGISILHRLRAAPDTTRLPVILLTARGTEYDKVVGLEVKSGARADNEGMSVFAEKFKPERVLLVGMGGIPYDEFLKINPIPSDVINHLIKIDNGTN